MVSASPPAAPSAAGAPPDPARSAPPAGAPVPPAARPANAPAPVPPPLEGSSRDAGAVRHDSLRVLDWTVRGASKVLGDATVGIARVDGIATVGGKFTAADVRVRGTLNVLATTEVATRLQVDGNGRFSASVRAGEFDSKGRVDLQGDLRVAGGIALEGVAELAGRIDGATLTFQGTLTVPGEIRLSGDLHGTPEGLCRVGPIRAQRVEVRRPSFPPWRRSGQLKTLRIEGTELRLEGVVAEFVKGDAIYLGRGCRIARVEGPILERHRDAVVGPSVVSDDIPRGLWR